MLKELTDRYYRMSTEAELLLKRAMEELHEEHAPSAEETLKISSALAEVQAAYSKVREYAAQNISDEDLPGEGAPVSAYIAIINSKRMITEGILKEFLLAYTDNTRFKEALEDTQARARQLLEVFREDASFEPDVVPYKAFVDGIKMGTGLDSEEGDELLEIVDAFDRKLGSGLRWGHFFLRAETACDEGMSSSQAGKAEMAVQQQNEPQEEVQQTARKEASDQVEADKITVATEEENGGADPDSTADAAGICASDASEDEYVYARNYKASNSLPSSKKMSDAMGNFTGAVVLATIGATHLISKKLVEVCPYFMPDHYEPTSWLDTLANKGYLVAYELEGEVYYCPSQMLVNCINKAERSKILQDIRNRLLRFDSEERKKRIPSPLLIGAERMKKSTLLEGIAWMNVAIGILKNDLPVCFDWDRSEEIYRVSGVGDAEGSLFTDVVAVTADKYSEWIAKEMGAVCAYGDVLPAPEMMIGAAAENCFFGIEKMYRWDESEWKEFEWENPSEDEAEDSASLMQERVVEENDESEDIHEEPAAESEEKEAEAPEIADEQQTDQPSQEECAEEETVLEDGGDGEAESSAVPRTPDDDAAEDAGEAAAEEEASEEVSVRAVPSARDNRDGLAASTRGTGSGERRDQYLKLAYEAYAAGRRGIGSALMRALIQMHPEVNSEWQKWACASADPAYTGGRNATRLQEIYPEANTSELADSALAVSAYIRMYFSNDAAKEYWVRSADAIASTKVLRQMGSLRELMQRFQNYVDANQCGINPAALVAMRQEFSIEDQFAQLKAKAEELVKARLTEISIGNPRLKSVFERLFENGSVMMSALQSICSDRRADARKIKERLEAINPGLSKTSQQAMESWIEFLWDNSVKKMKGNNANDHIQGNGRNLAVNRTKNALGVINQWIELCIHNAELPEQTVIAAAVEVKHLAQILPAAIAEVNQYMSALRNDMAGYGALLILEDTLKHFSDLVNGEIGAEPGMISNAEVAACSAMAVEEDGTVYIIPAEDMAVPYEQCDILAGVLKENPTSVEDAALHFVQNSMVTVDPNGGNFGNGRYLLNCAAKKYEPSLFPEYSDDDYAGKVKDAAAIVAAEDRKFHAHMEMAQGYGWFNSSEEQERVEHAVAAQCEMYRMINNYSACVECMKRTFNWCRETARELNHDRLMAELNDIIRAHDVKEDNVTIVRIRKLIEQDCYTAARAEIREIYKDNKRVTEDTVVTNESEFGFFVQNFLSYYAAVQNINLGMEKVFTSRNRYTHKGYVATGTEMMRAWPQSPEAVSPYNVRRLLNTLLYQMKIMDVVQMETPQDGHVAVKLEPEAKIEYVHPIADFGTRIVAGGLDIFFLGGNKEARSYFDMIRTVIGRGTGHAAIFLVNSAMSLSTRRQLASMIWHELRSTRPVLVLDRTLALYVAERPKEQRWNVLLQCALPFAMVKPYTENSSAQQPPEMFVGRVEELRRLKTFDQDGCILVYGGRQLGKSAILYRVEQEVHKPHEATYAVYCSIKDMNAAEAVRHIVLAMRRKNVPDAEKISLDASWADMCFEISVILTEHPDMKFMLLIDEADILLGKDQATNYSALSAIKRVQDALGNRFKYVFAGLHNVMRLHHNKAIANNSDMPKMGFINIKPLEYAEAEILLKKPLSYLGFMFNESEEQQALISMILSTTNYYPGLIHYYCASLLNTFSDGHTEPAPSKPPYELDNKLILKLLQKKEFMEQTKQKFMMTLGIDKDEHQYYSILAYLMAYCYDENESQVSGVSVDEICEAAESTGISVISRLETSQVETLLDELCELNILYCAHGSLPKRYVFSRPAFKDMLGTQYDVTAALLKYIDVEEVSQ